ncbi:adenylylsulfate reductase subunit alpha [Clostridia bacterium]|nr:adenylylsulfate reductase subunit alpha [Clostridia bacterium]
MTLEVRQVETDLLIIGGGTAGCYAALTFCEECDKRALIVEKAHIKRSGCLAAGINALNAYIAPGKTPQDYVDYAANDAEGIVRYDLLTTMAEGLNGTVERIEALGLTIQKDEDGNYAGRGGRNIKINGENIKPILAHAVESQPQITVLNHVNVFEFIVEGNRIRGAYAVGVFEPVLYVLTARAVLCATGGASGLYKPNNPGFSRHKMWYPPFNTGTGLACGIRAGAEMTSLEMRFIALRCKDTIAPTGTLALGVGARQVNALGEEYDDRYGRRTAERVYGTVMENQANRGPCALRTVGINPDQDADLMKAYLNMAPSQTLKWLESNKPPSKKNVEIEGTEPYIVGGHTASGYWVDTHRETTIRGLFAAGDVAGGCPQKYVTGAFVEGAIAAKAAVRYMDEGIVQPSEADVRSHRVFCEQFLNCTYSPRTIDMLEQSMQSAMDMHAGGIGSSYRFLTRSLSEASQEIARLDRLCATLKAEDMQELVYIFELRERLTLCQSVIAHMAARKETRWHSFCENADYPEKDSAWERYVNSRLIKGNINIILHPIVREGVYEHNH